MEEKMYELKSENVKHLSITGNFSPFGMILTFCVEKPLKKTARN